MPALWSSLARCPFAARGLAGQGAVLSQYALYRRFRSLMIPQLPKLQRAGLVQAGAAPVAEEEGQAFSALHHNGAQPSPASSLHQQHGFIEIICGPMFAGKSTELIRRVELQQQQGKNVAVVKSNKDDRYDLSHVVTHDGLKRSCYSVPSLAVFKHVAGPDYHSFQVIAIDEAQFFGDLAEFCATAADHEAKHLIVAGLDGDFQRMKFGQILDLVPFADTVTKLTAKCTICQQEAQAAAAAASSSNGVNGSAGLNGSAQRRPMGIANHAPSLGTNGAAAKHASAAAAAGGQAQRAQHGHQQAGAAPAVGGGGPRPALFSLRIAADSRQEVVGGADKYAPVCRHHYLALSQVRTEVGQSSSGEEQAAVAAGAQL